jgi:hypothetical protein
LFLLSPFVVVPLGFRLVPLTGRNSKRLLRIAQLVQPVGAVAALASFLIPVGAAAGIAAAGWLAVCGIASFAGLLELIDARSLHPAHLLPAAALGFLGVGGAWLVASRAGINLGYAPAIAELTGVHFHYAGFAATMMSVLALKALSGHPPRMRRMCATAGILVIFGTPLTATGIATGTGALTVIGPLLLATGILVTAAVTAFVIAPAVPSPAARWMLTISAATVVIPMVLGVDYAAARVLPIPALDLRTMALVHGDLNALGFALLGFAGWTLA